MKISKKDALAWFEFFAALDEEEQLMPYQLELAYAVLAQIETAEEQRQAVYTSLEHGVFVLGREGDGVDAVGWH